MQKPDPNGSNQHLNHAPSQRSLAQTKRRKGLFIVLGVVACALLLRSDSTTQA